MFVVQLSGVQAVEEADRAYDRTVHLSGFVVSVERSVVRLADTCAAPGAVYVPIESSPHGICWRMVLAKHPNLDVYTDDQTASRERLITARTR